MAASQSCLVRVHGVGVASVAPSGRCASWQLSRDALLCPLSRRRQRISPPPCPPLESASSSIAYPSPSEPLYSALLSALSSLPSPYARYSPPDLLLLTCVWPVLLRCLCARAAIVVIAVPVLVATPAATYVAPSPSLVLPLLRRPPPGSCGGSPRPTRPLSVPGRQYCP